jgi:hypothetical protein
MPSELIRYALLTGLEGRHSRKAVTSVKAPTKTGRNDECKTQNERVGKSCPSMSLEETLIQPI